MQAMSTPPVLLVTGASGHLGRRVVELLLDGKVGRVIAGTRDPAKVADLAAKGAEVRVIDFDKPETLAEGLKGVDRLLLVSTDSLLTRTEQQVRLVEAAAKAGVKHVVYTSAPAPRPSAKSVVADSHYWTEQALAASTLPGWTVLRNNIYAEIILIGLANALKSGQLYTATGKAGRNYVTREDCAAVAAAALASDFGGKRVLDVTGPAPVTQDEIAALASAIAGKTVTHVPLPPDALRQGMIGAGLPDFYADALVAFDVNAAEGYHAIATPTVKDLAGREPTSVKIFLETQNDAIRAMV
jgi:NAD(P)H dehydrogenase (quinone)